MMFFQYIKLSFKRLLHNKLYSIINIGGLSLSFGLAILIFLYVHYELNTDKYQKNLDNLYRLTENKDKSVYTAAKFGEYIKDKYPEIKYFTRYKEFNLTIQYDKNKSIKINHIAFMDSSCLDMFTIHIIKSNKSKLLRSNQSVIISETTAKKLFGETGPLGKTIRFENKHDYVIEGIFKDYPANSSLKANIIASFPSVKFFWGWPENNILVDEGNWSFSTYVLLNDGVNKSDLDKRLQKNLAERFQRPTEFYLQKYSSIYFDNEISDDLRHGNKKTVYLFLSIAIIIIFIAIINYINLSTSISADRAFSIGLYKTLGADKISLILQFMCETIIISLFSLNLGFVLAEIFLPTFNNLLQCNLQESSFYGYPFNIISIAIAILVGIFSGLYPSIYLTGFAPIEVLKGKVSGTKQIGFLKKGLMVFQFIISIVLITAAITVYRQLYYMYNRDTGVNIDNVIVLNPKGNILKHAKAFKEEIQKIPGVKDVCFSNGTIGNVGNVLYDNIDNQAIMMNNLSVDANFIDLFRIEVIDGKGFSKTNNTINRGKYLLNQTAVKYLGWNNPYEKDIWGWKCIGVVKDFNFASQQNAIGPLFICYNEDPTNVNIKISPANTLSTIKKIKDVWEKMSPDFPFEYKFVDDIFDAQYNNQKRLFKLLGYFAVFSIFIACLGLFGLISFMAEKRTKEIGIRKTNGASAGNIVLLFLKEFIQLIFISGIIAIALSYYILSKWLQNFAYATRLLWWVFVIPIIIAIIVSLLTVLYRTYRTASQNPVDALRYE